MADSVRREGGAVDSEASSVSLPRSLGAIVDARTIEVASALAAIPAPLGEEGRLAEAVAGFLDRPGIDVHLQAVVPGRPNVIATVRGRGQGPGAGPERASRRGVGAGRPARPVPRRDRGQPALRGWHHRHEGAAGRDDRGPRGGGRTGRPRRRSRRGSRPPRRHCPQPDGLGTKYALATEPSRAGQAFAIVGQGSNLELHTENSGAVKFEIELQGRAAHVSFQEEGIDALAAARRVADALASPSFSFTSQPSDRLPGFPKFVVGELIAGGQAGVPALLPGSGLADQAVLRGDVRTVPGMDRHTVTADLEAVVAAAAPDVVSSRVRIISDVHPFVGRRESPLIAALSAAHEAVRGAPPALATTARQRGFVTGRARLRGARDPVRGLRPGPWRYEPDE